MSRLPFQHDINEMRTRIMYVLINEMRVARGERRDVNKDTIWEQASNLYGPVSEYGPGLKATVFQELVRRGDIQDLGETIRITDQGANRQENQPPADLFPHH